MNYLDKLIDSTYSVNGYIPTKNEIYSWIPRKFVKQIITEALEKQREGILLELNIPDNLESYKFRSDGLVHIKVVKKIVKNYKLEGQNG